MVKKFDVVGFERHGKGNTRLSMIFPIGMSFSFGLNGTWLMQWELTRKLAMMRTHNVEFITRKWHES